MLYDYLVQHFASNDKIQSTLLEPDTQNGFVYASDAHCLISVPASECSNEYHAEKSPNYQKFCGAYQTDMLNDTSHCEELKTSELLEIVSNLRIRVKRNTLQCKKCEGTGEIECKCCGQDTPCKKCNGEGEVYDCNGFIVKEVVKYNKETKQPEYSITIGTAKIRPKYAELLLFTLIALNVKKAHYRIINDAITFAINDVFILFMLLK